MLKLVNIDGRWFIQHNGAAIAVKAVQTMVQNIPSNIVVIKVLLEQHRSSTFGLIDAKRVVEFYLLAKQLADKL